MAKLPGSLLRWSEENRIYELISHDYVEHCFRLDDGLVWLDFLETHTSFAFQGREGRLSVMKEARPRGAGYWYAYRVTGRRTNKHYLGKTTNVTTTRLEEAARALNRVTSSMPVREQAFAAGSLLLSKLQPPRLPSTLVERSRLLQRLDTALERKLTLLVAPAGCGKTTLVNQWMHDRQARTWSKSLAWNDLLQAERQLSEALDFVPGEDANLRNDAAFQLAIRLP